MKYTWTWPNILGPGENNLCQGPLDTLVLAVGPISIKIDPLITQSNLQYKGMQSDTLQLVQTVIV